MMTSAQKPVKAQLLFLAATLCFATACASTPKKPAPTPAEPVVTTPKTQPKEDDQAAQADAQAKAQAQQAAQEADAQAAAQAAAAQKAEQERQEALAKDPMLLLNDKSLRGPKDLVLTAVGDVSQPTKQWPEPTNRLKTEVFTPTKALLDSGDLIFMNLENPVSDLQPKVKKEFSFTSAPERLGWYMDVGFNLFSLSNNHIADAGQEGIDDTLRHLKEKSEARSHKAWWAGASSNSYDEAESATYIELPDKNLKIAYFSTGNSRGAFVSKYWSASLLKKIKEAKTKADLVIVSVHGGKEYQHLPEQNITNIYHSWVDQGADLVIGHHPHVIRPVEVYKQSIIIHSLGNYVFASRTKRHRKFKAKMYGLITRVVIKDGKVRGVAISPTWVNNSEDWVLEDGQRMKNANFVPQLITGKFADVFFEDFLGWTQEAGFQLPVRKGDEGILIIPSPDVALAP